jgi:hypothetical protein
MTDLEHQLDHELRRLPAPKAPVSLMPRVMLAVAQAESAPWYSRAWMTWPVALQVSSAAFLALVVIGLWRLMPSVLAWMPAASPVFGQAMARLAPAVQVFSEVATLVRVLWSVIIQPIALYFLALVIALSLVCAVFWTAVNRVALGGASRS